MGENKRRGKSTDPPGQAVVAMTSNEQDLDCLFSPTGNKKTMNGKIWIECSSICHSVKFHCCCFGKSNCVNKWHRTDENMELYKQSVSSHAQKPKNKNYTT